MDLINMGKETRRMSVEEKKSFHATLSKDQKRLFLVLEKLLEQDPTLIERVVRASREHASPVTRDLKKQASQSNGRSEDMTKVAREMPGWKALAWDPPLGEKPTRGLFHIQCAELLCPIQHDWSDPKICEDFLNMRLSATPSQFTRYLWLDNGENYNPQRPSDGLLRNEILICAAFCIFYSPTSVKSINASTTQASGARGCSFRRSKGMTGIAKSYNLTKLSVDWFNIVSIWITYYNHIREFLEAPRFASRAKVLLEWWNMRIFSSFNLGSHVDDKDGAGTLDALNAEVEGDPGLSGDEEPRPRPRARGRPEDEDEEELEDDQ
ncbi:unnamed protein product [Rhizoctonia solani]|uniref:Uncharacterized protein n=1 Tax=Rhizoctonia solani TaxID=456999 RepID=A0A8H3BQI2_9AGAM|nr:unnamed protein product [Rhizoctonia solani]